MKEAQVHHDFYYADKYFTLSRFVSYFYQLKMIRETAPHTILLVGVGDSVVPSWLKRDTRYRVTTCDIDEKLQPDVVGDIRALPFSDNTFDTVCAFEVLEHLPFEESKRAYKELIRVSAQHVLVSVPHRRTGVEIVLKFPYIRTITGSDYIRLALRLPVRFPGVAVSKQHYWEIDWYTTRLAEVRGLFGTYADIMYEETPLLDMYQRFFFLRKNTDNQSRG